MPARGRIALDFPAERSVAVGELRLISPRIAEAYAGKQQKAITRDINELVEMGLLSRVGQRGRLLRVNREIIRAFLPVRAATE